MTRASLVSLGVHVLLLTEFAPRTDDGEITGGVEAYCHYVAAGLRKRGHDVTTLARPTDGAVWDAANLASIPQRLLFLARALISGLRHPGDVIVATTYVVHPVAWMIGLLRRRPVVFWYPDVLIGTWMLGGFGRVTGIIGEATERVVVRLPVDRFIAISESTAAKLSQHGVDPAQVSVIPCGFEPAIIASLSPEQFERPTIVSAGRLVPYKRVDLIIESLPRVVDAHPDVELIVIGQGPELPRLRQLADDLGVSRHVEFRGYVPRHTDVLAAIGGAVVFASASEIEGFGIVLAEAMALDTPYVVTDIPAFREVSGGGVAGRLFERGRSDDLADKLIEMLSNRETSQATGEGSAHAQQYEWGTITDRTIDVLERVIADRARRRSANDVSA